MEDAAVGQVDVDLVGRRMANHVAIGEHVRLGAELDDHAGAGFLDFEQALEFGQRRGFDVDDGRRHQLHDALDEAELAAERFDVAGQRRVFASR